MDFSPFLPPADDPLTKWAKYINQEADLEGVPPCALGAVIKNEEAAGENGLQIGKRPGPGCGVGLGQITYGVDWTDIERPTYNGLDLLDPQQNLRAAARYFLAPAIQMAQALRADLPDEFGKYGSGQILYFAFAIYNAGETAVRRAMLTGLDPDQVTTRLYAHRALEHYESYVAGAHAGH